KKHYYPDNESDYESSTASSNYDSYDTDLGFSNVKRQRTIPRQTSSPAMFVKSQLAHRPARPKLGDFVRKPTVGGNFKRKYGEVSTPAGCTTNKKPLLSRSNEQNGPRESIGPVQLAPSRLPVKGNTIIKKEKHASKDCGRV